MAPEIDTEVAQTEVQQPFIRRHSVWSGVILAAVLLFASACYGYAWFFRKVTARRERQPAGNVAVYYAAPRRLAVGEELGANQFAAELQAAGYANRPVEKAPYFVLRGANVEVHPGPSYTAGAARIVLQKGQITSIVSLRDLSALQRYPLEPRPFANLNGQNLERHDDLRYGDIPDNLTHAILAAEDKRFFQHPGFDVRRIAKAIYVNWKAGRKEQGGSTLTMQLARSLWLGREKTWTRKLQESLITIALEQKFSKQRIFEMYCNNIYLGRHATYDIYGFSPAAHAYFDKKVQDLTVPEAALLAGMAQRPTYFDPLRNPEHAVERRNMVLGMMRQNGYLSDGEWQSAMAAPLAARPRILENGAAPYFLALASDEAQRLSGEESSEVAGARIYTTLDQDLQNAAQEAVQQGMKSLLAEVKAHKKYRDGAIPQVALIALDPHTGEVKAVVGGRNYAESQLNHALSKRQPGSVFKPFVYAAALQSSGLTAGSSVDDVPTTFRFGRQLYTPGNFGQRFYGRVTVRQALAHSLNVATIKVAEETGYDRVVSLAHNAGLNEAIRATPSVALGAYEATPLEIAGAYTIFANNGVYVKPTFLSSVDIPDKPSVAPDRQSHAVLDNRLSFLMTDLLQEVVRSGTAARVRSLGLTAPVAGKTGTSRDGWFAGYTSGLLCVVWVGYDDNRELGLEGARSALPIWAEFMKRAVRFPGYARPFNGPPDGVVAVKIDAETGQLAGPNCPDTRSEYFLAGTEPQMECAMHNSTPEEPGVRAEVIVDGETPRRP